MTCDDHSELKFLMFSFRSLCSKIKQNFWAREKFEKFIQHYPAINQASKQDPTLIVQLHRKKTYGGSIAQWLVELVQDPAVPGTNLNSGGFLEKKIHFAVLIDSTMLL